MRNKSIIQVGVVASADPNQFEEQLNSRLRELADYNPTITSRDMTDGIYRVMFEWTENESTAELFSVKDEFNADGIRFICAECPLHDIETDKRRKRVSCKYADNGITHLEHECCEYFYKLLKQNRIEPIVPEPDAPGLNKVRGTVR